MVTRARDVYRQCEVFAPTASVWRRGVLGALSGTKLLGGMREKEFMTADDAADLVRQALTCVMILAAPAILIALVCGLLISLLQAVTSLQDQTISTVPNS